MWKTTWSSALETDGTAEHSLHISESVVSQAEHCTNAQIAVDVTTVTMTGTYADTRNEVTMVVTGTQGASDVMSLGRQHITSAELGLRRNVSVQKAYRDALLSGVPYLGPAGFCRASAVAKFLI